mmetsp:Transcript_47637/g.116033  ORF Transcript_47637/g.116033 Transcript_47637/m.116033 type:complete len:239 (+) Transcript_47637:27-743(+)
MLTMTMTNKAAGRVQLWARRKLPAALSRRRQFSSAGWDGHGTDLLSDSLAHNSGVPKIILHGHSSSGFDVINMVKNLDPNDTELKKTGGIVHMAGSILVLPGAAFLWNVRSPKALTVDSICPPLQLLSPPLEYLFIGSPDGAGSIDPVVLDEIRQTLHDHQQLLEQQQQKQSSSRPATPRSLSISSGGGGLGMAGEDILTQNLVVEPMDLTNAMGTFNILNGEDRRVGAALILPKNND